MRERLPILIFTVVMAAIPHLPEMPPFWIVLLDNIGLSALVAMGLVLLTGVGGLTSFGQAAFVGFGAYTTAVLTTAYGLSPWLTLPASLLVSGIAAVLLGLVTVRLSGHYLPLGTIAWGLGLFYLFSKLEFLGRNDGISGIPPLAIGSLKMLDPGTIYYAIWAAVLIAALLTMNLLDSRTGRAIRALRRGHIAAEAFGVETPRSKLLVFIHAAVLAGLSGWLYAHFQRAVNPTPFGAEAGIEYLFIAVVGGAGYVWGGVLGAAIVVVLKEVLQSYLPLLLHGEGQLEIIVFGILLVALLQLAPSGVWPLLASLLPLKPKAKRPDQSRPDQSHPDQSRRNPFLHLPARAHAAGESGVLLQVDKARKQFGGVIAVNDVSFDVRAREIVALIGPNGAGKSTTFNLITGVLSATSGAITVNGKRLRNPPPQEVVKLGIARTFQHVKLVPDMTVLENVAIGAHLRGSAGPLSSMFRLDRADEARLLAEAARQIARVGLAEQMDQPAGSLSLGQQRIVEIARALCADPMLLLLDEPAAGLRHMEKQRLASLLRQLRDGGMSVLLVEHDMGFVMDLAERIVVLDFGTKIAEGTPAAIKANPEVIKAYLGAAA
jgi:ABC-type branched-subunit amino acid transport system ATPase component/ABC-type branched-subunit amino acid transport system permease subunit